MAVKLLGDLSASGDATFNSEVNLASGGQIDWANGDARIREGLVTDYSLSLQTWTGSALTTKMFIASGGNVGIGTTSPTSTLDVSGIITTRNASILRRHVASWNNADTHDIIYNGWTSDMGDYVYLKAQGNSTGDHGMMIVGDNVAYVGRSNVETGAANSGLDQTWATFKNGGVGIGTTTPLEKLHVVGKINSSNNIVSNATYTMFTGRSSRTVDDYGGLNKEYFKANLVTPGPNTTGESSAHGIADLRFQLANSAGNTGMSDIMTLRSGGNVGIGTTSPADKLVVVGNATIHSGANLGTLSVGRSSTQNIKIYVDDTNNTITAYQDSDGNSEHIFALDRQFDGTGANNFFIRKGGSNQLGLDTSGNLRLYSYGAGILKTDANGNVSLDTSTYATQTWVGEQNYASDAAISTAVASYLPLAGGTMTGRLIIDKDVAGDGSWDDVGILLRNDGSPTGELSIAFDNTGTGSNYWIYGLNQGTVMTWGYGTSFVGGNDKMLLDTSGNLQVTGTYGFKGGSNTITDTKVGQWDTAYGWGDHASAGYLEDITPATPSVDSTAVVGETIEITFSQSSTADVDYYQVWSAVGSSGSYGMIAHVPQEDVAATMTVIDADFTVSDTIYYRVYAVKSGVYSTAGTANRAFSSAALDVSNMLVVNLNTAYYIQYEMPTSRFVDHVEIYMDAEAASGDLTRTGATLVYSGNNSSYMYKIGANDLDKFHQFWVEVIES